jgi:hypothetical protein
MRRRVNPRELRRIGHGTEEEEEGKRLKAEPSKNGIVGKHDGSAVSKCTL